MQKRRPSLDSHPKTHGLWSLWDMLAAWAHIYFHVGGAISYMEMELYGYTKISSGVADPEHVVLPPEHEVAKFVVSKCDEVLRVIRGVDLGTLPIDVELVKAKAMGRTTRQLRALDLHMAVRDLQTKFTYVLANRQFYSIPSALADRYGKPELFGPEVAKKFSDASGDIERAGNCLALGEPTACVLHLNRAMEIAVRRLAKKLKVKLDPRDSWGDALRQMEDPIKQLPANTPAAKHKKELWAASYAILAHVKMAWRDPASHGTRSYVHKEAADILKRTEDFLQHLARLL